VRAVSALPDSQPDRGLLHYGRLTIDREGMAIFVGGRDVRLTFSEFVLLETLAARPYRVTDREALLQAIHAAAPAAPAQCDPRLIDRHITRLRKKLRDAGYDCIQTMRFAGYRFTPLEQAHERTSEPLHAQLASRAG
jgi:two-component system response regulator ChvI